MYESHIVFCLYIGHDSNMGDLPFFLACRKKQQVSRPDILHFDFGAHGSLLRSLVRQLNIYGIKCIGSKAGAIKT